jgi:hypothetical protein
VDFHETNEPSKLPPVVEFGQRALADLEFKMREEAQRAARRCAHAMLVYIRANPQLLYADVLPTAEGEALRSSLTGYVGTLRALGTPPERVLVAVKELVKDAAADARIDTRGLTGAAVQWAIAAYFPLRESQADSPTPAE